MTKKALDKSKLSSEDTDISGKMALFVIVVMAILALFFVYMYLDEWRVDKGLANQPEATITSGSLTCIELGCPVGTDFMGSKQGNVYHECDSSYSKAILEENRVCFPSAVEANARGYRESQ